MGFKQQNRTETLGEMKLYLGEAWMRYQRSMWEEQHQLVTQADFATSIGIPPTTLSELMRGVRPPSDENTMRLAEHPAIGPRIYDILGVPPHMPANKVIREIASHWHLLNDQEQKVMRETYEQLMRAKEEGQKQEQEIQAGKLEAGES
jgi:transcriptional regulator with XRE-family HTH domain